VVQEERGGAGVYSADMRKKWQLEDDSWKYDIMPEIMDGRNVADFVDPDIEAQLAQLEKEEDALAAAAALEVSLSPTIGRKIMFVASQPGANQEHGALPRIADVVSVSSQVCAGCTLELVHSWYIVLLVCVPH